MAQLTEQEIINLSYYILEQDNTLWETTSAEYLTARGILKSAVIRWENYEMTNWRELWGTLTDAADGDKTTNASDWDYAAPTNFVRPSSYVKTKDSAGNRTLWRVISPGLVAKYANSEDNVCWFTGSKAGRFTLHFNPKAAITAGETIEYEYYKMATATAATTDKVEMNDPNFAVYWIVAHMADGGIDNNTLSIAEQFLEQMKDTNEKSLELVPDNVEDTLDNTAGFGT